MKTIWPSWTKHIDDVVNGRNAEFLEINKIASELAISHTHLTDVLQQEMGNHPYVTSMI